MIFLLSVLGFAVQAQTQVFTVEDGLSNKEITCILQTRNGYIWIGTANGLNLYDGYTFYEFNRHNGLSNGKITCLHEDKNGLLWIGTWQGLNVLDPANGHIRQFFQEENTKPAILNSEITCMEELPDGSMLVSVGNGSLMRFKNKNDYEKVYELRQPGVIKYQISSIRAGKDNEVSILTNYNIVIKFLSKSFKEDTAFKYWEQVVDFYPVKNGTQLLLLYVWGDRKYISATSGVLLKETPSPKPVVFPEPLIASRLDRANELWAAYADGSVWCTDLETEKSVDYSSQIKRFINGLPTCIYPDRNGTIWIGSNYGLIKFCPKQRYFENYLVSQKEEYKSKNSIRGMIEDAKGDIYIGGYNGLFKMNQVTGEVHRFEFKNYPEAEKRKAFYPYRLLDDGNYLWITSETRGFYRFDKNREIIEFPLYQHGFFKAFAFLNEGDSLWIGTHHGLFIYNKKRNVLTKYNNPADQFDIAHVEVTELVKDSEGNMWIGTYSSGIFKKEKNGGIVQRFSNAGTPYALNFVTALFFENDSILWVGTRGSGLGRVNIHKGDINFYTKRNGLADNSVAGIIKDNTGIFWISTFNGLSRFNVHSGVFENYYDKDGLSDNEFNTLAYLKTKRGKIYFGGLNGINAFYPSSLHINKLQRCTIFLTQFAKYDGSTNTLNEQVLYQSALQPVSLTHHDKFFSFSFTLDDYYRPLRNTFFYRLDGYDNSWNNIGTQHTIRFNSLPAGSYQLRIKGLSSAGVASANELLIPIHVSPAFYNTWWFYVLLFLITVAVVYSITRYRIYQGLKIRKLRTKISSDLHDEVGSLLTRISVQAELIKQGISQSDTVQEVARIADTSRMATAAMSDVLWSIDARNDRMGNLVDRLREQAGEILFPLEIDVEFVVQNIDATKEIDNIIRQNLFLIFKEAIHNIAKHAQATKVNVLLENRGNQFVMMIEDNGSGTRKPGAALKQGQGLRNMKMRAGLMEGTLDIDTTQGYKITLKLKKIA